MRFPAKLPVALIVCLVLAAWIFALRWPYFARPAWNLDEGIHATVARTILHGGVMYRDAIDQRTPLTYYLVAGIFGIFGENNMTAAHAVLAGMIVATALGLFLLGRRWRGTAAGVWAALTFGALSTNLLYIGDSYALGTEWFVILFTTWSAWWLWRNWESNSVWPAGLAGAGFAAAFLCKQTGLMDFAAPLATLIFAATTGQLRGADAARRFAGLCAGFVGLTAVVFAYFWVHGALDDFYFYAWSYNLAYYGPETTSGDRWAAAAGVLQLLGQQYAVIGSILMAATLVLLVRLVQMRPTPEERKANLDVFYLLSWALFSWGGAASSGRTFNHYYVQLLPAFALLAGWLLADCHAWWQTGNRLLVRGASGVVIAVAAWTVVAGPLRGPWPASLGPDSGLDAAGYIRSHSRPADRIFVWGYSPDFYLYADRQPASRYLYCSFLTGLIPWTNIAPERDTSYAIVPGAMEILLRELAAGRPEFIVDTSLGAGRHFEKYPLTKFPRLAAFVAANYLEIEPVRFRAKGIRVLQLKDSARRQPRVLAGGAAGGLLDEPALFGPATVDPVAVTYEAKAAHSTGRLQRLELLVDDRPAESLTFDPVPDLTADFVLHFDRVGRGKHRLAVRATAADGETRTGPVLNVECAPESLPAAEREAFAMPTVHPGTPPNRIISSFGVEARVEAGALVFFAHAPSSISYALPPGAVRLRGRFGFRPGAYAATNPGRTDGAEFVITWIGPGGRRTELLRRWLRPWEEPADRGEHGFDLALPATADGTLELAIGSGPAGNSASDWTYWSDLLLSTSR